MRNFLKKCYSDNEKEYLIRVEKNSKETFFLEIKFGYYSGDSFNNNIKLLL